MNRWLETDTQKTARSIINALNESAAGMVKKEINKDKPEEAPKNKKVALEKRITRAAIKGKKPESKNAKMPKKIAKKIVREVDNKIMNELEEIKVKKKVFTESTYLNENEKLYLGRKAEVKRDVEDTDLHKGDIVTIDSVEVDVDGWDSDYVNVTRESDGKEFSGVSSYELNLLIDEGCGNKIVKEELEPETKKSIEDQIADLQDYLNNTPEIAEDEKEAIQAEIDDLISQLGEDEMKDSNLKEDDAETATFEIDYADDDVDLSTEESVIEDVRNWLGTLANEVKIEVPELSGPAGGWPIVRLTGNKEKIAKFLLDNYNSGGEETLDDVYDLYLQENKLQEDNLKLPSEKHPEETKKFINDYQDKKYYQLTKIGLEENNLNEAELFEKEKLNETGEWDDNDDEMKIWKEELRDKAEYIANEIHGSVASISGFDKYQGPVAIISTPIHGDVQLWFDNEDDTGLSLLCKIAHVGWIQGGANYISDRLSREVIPEDEIINESEKLNEKINHANDDINRAIANPNLGKNRDKIHAAGYEVTDYGLIKNPKTKKWVDPSQYSREEKKKVDFKGKLDSERKNNQGRYYPEYVPKSLKTGKGRGYAQADRDDMEAQNGISKNVKDYKAAVKTRDENRRWAERNRKNIPHYEKKVKDAQKDLEFQKNYTDKLEKNADSMENKRKEILNKARAMAKKESMKEDIEFKVGDVVKVPYKYGSYTPGKFTEAPIIDISEGRYVTVEIPSKLEVTMDQLKKWNTLEESDNEPKTVKEYRIMDGNKVLKTFSADEFDKGYAEMRAMGKALKDAGKEDNLIYKEFIVKNKLKEAYSDKRLNEEYDSINDNVTYLRIINFIDNLIYSVDDEERKQICAQLKKDMDIFGGLNESLKEAYSDKLGGDPANFVPDVEAIKAKLSEIDTSGFGSRLAAQMVEDWIETCDYQIEKGKRLASGDEFYTEADERTYKDKDEAEYYRNKELYANSNLARHREAMEKAKKACEEKGIKLDEDNYLSHTRKEEPLDLVAYKPEITSIDEVKDKYVKIRGDFHKVIDVKPDGDKFVISFAAGTGTAIGGEFEPATLDEIKRLQLYTENK